ncbi:MAG: DUF5686 family protein [Paludibacter sp.]|nr:DUF5686 family protein [Paludibacter sp.]
MRRFLSGVSIFLFLIFTEQLHAQETLVVGHVRSKTDNSPLSAVNIYFKGTNIGVQSDEEGFYVIRNQGTESKLVFSCVGYKTQEIPVRPGEVAGVEVALREDINILQELFVLPGANPALDLMRKVREAKAKNDVYNLPLTIASEEQNLVLISKNSATKKLFKQLSDGSMSTNDTTNFLPLYIEDVKYLVHSGMPRKVIAEESTASPQNVKLILEKLTGNLQPELNFYNNSISLFGKPFVSPLSSAANSYYRFFLIDSIGSGFEKQYYLRFKTKNNKNLAFNGELWIDSASCALTAINVELPVQANINFIQHLKVSKTYKKSENKRWFPVEDRVRFDMNYQLLADSAHLSPEIYIETRITSSPVNDTVHVAEENFAGSEFSKEELELKLAEMNDLPMMKTAHWIADAIITGYMQLGKIDLGKVYQFARLTDVEGFRFSIPIRTNENLSKNFSLGGYWGYGTRNRAHQYAASVSYKLPFASKSILSIGYTDDYRRIDYDYNDYLLRENPLLSGDEDIANTIFAFRSSDKINRRKEFFTSLSLDWNKDVESNLCFRKNSYWGNPALPFLKSGIDLQEMTHDFISFNTRFSRGERTYEDHLERIYIQNLHPVFYLTLEGGRTRITDKENFYGRITGKVKQQLLFDFGQWNYSVDAGWILGTVPYNLLSIPVGSETLLFKRYHYNLMDYMEYAFDKYVAMHHEWIFNGVLFNQLPVIRNLNLRELVTFKFLYGGLDPKHASLVDFPSLTGTLKVPYMEAGVGFTNIFRIFSLQSVWRLSDLNKPGVRSWGIITGIRFNF